MKLSILTALASLFLVAQSILAAEKVNNEILLQEDFEKADMEMLPKGFLVLNGDFTIQEVDGNKVLHLPENPLDDYSVLFGPNAKEGIEVRARIHSESRRRLTPRFGVGLNGVNGYKLLLTPSKKALEIWRGQEPVKEIPFEWESGQWTHFALRVFPQGEHWLVQGKAWQEKVEKPDEWQIDYEEKEEPINGKPSIWGAPYSSKPILFDDLLVKEVAE